MTTSIIIEVAFNYHNNYHLKMHLTSLTFKEVLECSKESNFDNGFH